MTNKTKSSAIHRVTWIGNRPTFHCDGDASARCHNYPSCECVYWSSEHVHPDVPQERCWQLDWLDADPDASYYDGGTFTSDVPPRIDGVIDTEWEGECLLWCYADSAAVEAATQAVAS